MGAIIGTAASIAMRFTDEAAMKDAYENMRNGLRDQRTALKEDYDLERVANLVKQYDKGYLDRRVELQKEFEPEMYAAGQQARKDILAQAQTPVSALESSKTARKLFAENIDEDPELAKLKQNVISRANDVLSMGGDLPAEYQAELIRAGVSGSAQAGVKPQAATVGGVVSKVLGSEGEKLRQARTMEATKLADTAQSMTESRAKILGSIFPTIQSAEREGLARSAAIFGLANSTEAGTGTGLTGREMLNLDLSGRQAQRDINSQIKNLRAWRALEFARIRDTALNQSAGNWGGTATGAYGGAGGGGGGGGSQASQGSMGSIMGMAGGMMSDKNSKENIETADESAILEKVSRLPVSNWDYKKDVENVPQGRHTGPMAQDWDVLFGSGKGDAKTIPIVDAIGVALASVKALVKEIKQMKTAKA
jgi:hypothetical protein